MAMSMIFTKASTSDALTLNGISRRAFDSDVLVGASSIGGPVPSVSYKDGKIQSPVQTGG